MKLTKTTGHCKNGCPLSPVAIKFAMGIMKEKQEETILHFISGQDIFVSLPTVWNLTSGLWQLHVYKIIWWQRALWPFTQWHFYFMFSAANFFRFILYFS